MRVRGGWLDLRHGCRCCTGSSIQIDVSGDGDVAWQPVALLILHALGLARPRLLRGQMVAIAHIRDLAIPVGSFGDGCH